MRLSFCEGILKTYKCYVYHIEKLINLHTLMSKHIHIKIILLFYIILSYIVNVALYF